MHTYMRRHLVSEWIAAIESGIETRAAGVVAFVAFDVEFKVGLAFTIQMQEQFC